MSTMMTRRQFRFRATRSQTGAVLGSGVPRGARAAALRSDHPQRPASIDPSVGARCGARTSPIAGGKDRGGLSRPIVGGCGPDDSTPAASWSVPGPDRIHHTHAGRSKGRARPLALAATAVTGWIDAGSVGAERQIDQGSPRVARHGAPQIGRVLVNIARTGRDSQGRRTARPQQGPTSRLAQGGDPARQP